MFAGTIAWFTLVPFLELPRTSIRPLPNTFLRLVCASDPEASGSSFSLFVMDVLVDGLRGDGGKVTAFILAKPFRIVPIQFLLPLSTPKVAMAAILLPVSLAS